MPASKCIHYSLLSILLYNAVNTLPAAAEGTATYRGDISLQHNRDFFRRVQDQKIQRLIITSSGGEVLAGIELGHWVYRQQLTLEVRDYCFSSCANYVFTAAADKIIRPGAIVAWHGNYHHLYQTGLWRDEIPLRMQRYGESRAEARQKVLQQVTQLVKSEKEFFAAIGVDQYLCWIGKMPPYSVENYYFLSPADMIRFGVNNVQVPENYPVTDTTKFDVSIKYLSLNRN